MKNEEVLSNGKVNKKVHWALNLEEIFLLQSRNRKQGCSINVEEIIKTSSQGLFGNFWA